MLPLFYNDIYTHAISIEARFPRDRYRLVYEELQSRHCENWAMMMQALPASREQVLRVHDATYVDAFLQGQLDESQIRQIGFRPWQPDFVERTMTIIGGSIQALEAAISNHGFACNLAGGTHHAYAYHGEGFCVFNDLAICTVIAREDHGYQRVAIIDCDVHQGNGTAAIFADEFSVMTYSIHGEKNYPFRKEQSDIDIGLPDGTGDDSYLQILEKTLIPAIDDFQPDLLLYQAGCDPLATDKLGKLSLSRQGLQQRNALVMQLANDRDLPMVIFMGGGYAEPITDSVVAHADVFYQSMIFQNRRYKHRSQ